MRRELVRRGSVLSYENGIQSRRIKESERAVDEGKIEVAKEDASCKGVSVGGGADVLVQIHRATGGERRSGEARDHQ